jgi:hypothetical protein
VAERRLACPEVTSFPLEGVTHALRVGRRAGAHCCLCPQGRCSFDSLWWLPMACTLPRSARALPATRQLFMTSRKLSNWAEEERTSDPITSMRRSPCVARTRGLQLGRANPRGEAPVPAGQGTRERSWKAEPLVLRLPDLRGDPAAVLPNRTRGRRPALAVALVLASVALLGAVLGSPRFQLTRSWLAQHLSSRHRAEADRIARQLSSEDSDLPVLPVKPLLVRASAKSGTSQFSNRIALSGEPTAPAPGH